MFHRDLNTLLIITGNFGQISQISLTLSWRKSLSNRDQSITLQWKSVDWFLYDKDYCHVRVKVVIEYWWLIIWNNRPEVFCEKGILKSFAKLTGKHLCRSLSFNKVADLRWDFEEYLVIGYLWWLFEKLKKWP